MVKNTESSAVVFRCACGQEVPGRPEDALITSTQIGETELTEMFKGILRRAPFDRTTKHVLRNCVCGLDYMCEVRLGTEERVFYVCDCGHSESPHGN